MLRSALSTLFALAIYAVQARAACTCGPDYCLDDTRIPAALAAKKKELADAGFPPRLVSLFKERCFAGITRAPTNFRIKLIYDENHSQSVDWSIDNEDLAKHKLTSSELKRYWIYNSARAFACCGEPNYSERSDYDATDDVNTSAALRCDSQTSC